MKPFSRQISVVVIVLISVLLANAIICLLPKDNRQSDQQKIELNLMPGWVKILSEPEKFDGKQVRVRGVFTHKNGAGTGVEIWIAKWAIEQGQLEFFIHLQEESAIAFFGGNHTLQADELEGRTVEVTGTFIAHSTEGISSDLVAIGNVTRIMVCDLDNPTKAGASLVRPEPKLK